MSAGWAILAVLLNLAAAGMLVYWGVGLWRLVQTLRKVPTARAGVALARERPARGSVCIVVPAHNEEASIGPLVESLKVQDYPEVTVLLCLDRCTDQTRCVIEERAGRPGLGDFDRRFRTVEIGECPGGWAGKVNAAWTGASQPVARAADYLLFLDADVVLDPGCISAVLALAEDRRLDLLSLLSTLTTSEWFERTVQPAAGLELLRQYPILRANRVHGRRAFANGQFMLFRREAYDAIGGHEAVRNELLEDIALARRIAGAGRSAGLFVADGMVICRMYDSWESFRRGWKRIYTESARCKVERLRKAAVISMVMGAVLPVIAAVNLVFSLALTVRGFTEWGLAGLVLSVPALSAWLVVIACVYRAGKVPLRALPGFIVGSWLVGGILMEGARDLREGRAVEWGGRTYVRQAR